MTSSLDTIYKLLAFIEDQDLYPDVKTVSSGLNPLVTIGNDKINMFCTNNYLNIATHPTVIKAALDATTAYGTGSGGSRLVSGTTDLHKELEKEIAELKGTDDALVFSSGYLTNIGVISTLANPLSGLAKELSSGIVSSLSKETVVLGDELNHASIIDACKIAKVQLVPYSHLNMADLREKLIQHSDKRLIIVTDGVFSMDGDIAPLPEIVSLAGKFNAMTIVDDAHGTGILGKTGGGVVEYFNLTDSVDVHIGTLNKVFAGVGGFVAANKKICKFLRVTSRPYIFSASMPPGVAGGLIAAIKLLKKEPVHREKLMHNINFLKGKLQEKKIPFLSTFTPIIPVIIGDEKQAVQVSQELFNRGFLLPAIRWPAVPKGKARLRITLMSDHTEEQISSLVDVLGEILTSIDLKNNVK